MKLKLIPVILTAALTSVATLYISGQFQNSKNSLYGANNSQLPVNYAAYDGSLSKSEPVNFELAAESSVKAVVHIKTKKNGGEVLVRRPFWGGDILERQRMPEQTGAGSGVIISPDGYIVTNNHVVAGADEVTVSFNDRYTTDAKVLATDPATDLALLKVKETNLPYMQFGNSDNVKLGQWVLAVGYPLTLETTVTAGIVSAKGRSIGINQRQSASAIESFIQTDAAVNPGNSGGALVNTSGQLIGINSAIASPTGSYAGYSYAIPANIVKKVANDMIKYGSVQRAFLGIQLYDRKMLPTQKIEELGMDRTEGVYVANVTSGGGAEEAGLKKGDFITHINGITVNSSPQLMEQVAIYKPGDNISITYLRNGSTKTANVQLKNIEGTTAIIKEDQPVKIYGATVKTVPTDIKQKYAIKGGVLVENVGSGELAKQTPMKNGFVITSIDDREIQTLSDLQSVLSIKEENLRIAGFYPGTNGMYYYGLNKSGATTHSEQ